MARGSLFVMTALGALISSTTTAAPVLETSVFDSLRIAPGSSTSAAQPKIDEGLAALQRNDLPAADTSFKAALAIDRQLPLSYLGLAEVAARLNKDVAVESWLRKGLSTLPANFRLLYALGVWYAKKRNFDDAEKQLSEAIRVEPKSVEALTALGEVYLARSKTIAKAEPVFRKAIAVDAKFIPAQVGLARALAGQGKPKEARTVLENAAAMAPADPMPLITMGRLEASQGNLDTAISHFRKATEIAPKFLPAYMDLGDIYLARDDPNSAATAYREGAGNAKNPAAALFRLGIALQAAQRWDEAERAYLDTTEKDPRVFGAYNNLAFMLAERKVKLDQALIWIEKAAEIAPLSATVRDTKGWIYRARGDLQRAAATIEEARKLNPKDAAVPYHLGVVYFELGRKADAATAFKQALKLGLKARHAASAQDYLKRLGAAESN